MNLSSSTEKSKTWLKEIDTSRKLKESIEIQNLDAIIRDSHRIQQNVKPSKEKKGKIRYNPEDFNFYPKNEEESLNLTLSKMDDQSLNISKIAELQKMHTLE